MKVNFNNFMFSNLNLVNGMMRLLIITHIIIGNLNAALTDTTDLHLGHFCYQIDYTLTPEDPNAGWNFSISYDTTNNFNTPDGIVRLSPSDTVIVATAKTKQTLNASFLGLGEQGDSIWILPQNNQSGKIFFGWRNIIAPGIFQQSYNGFYSPSNLGNIKIELTDVSGTAVENGGGFAMWESQSLGGIEEHFNSANGIDSNDRVEPVPVGSHTHYNWAMTKPGNYEVTFRATGRLNPWHGGLDTIGEETFYFSVPFSSIAKGYAELRLSLDNLAPAAIHPVNEPVEYSPKQVVLITEPKEINGQNHPFIFTFDLVTDSTTAESNRVGISGSNPLNFPEGINLTSNPIEILQSIGPGNLEILTTSTTTTHFSFSENGIYRILMQTIGSNGTSSYTTPPIELIFLVDLSADYDFQAYANSYERTYNLTPGSLKNDGSDWDLDGIPDIVEYQLFWHGLDPAVPDATKLPKPLSNDSKLITFYRDTYKDTLGRDDQNILLEHSMDLTNWLGWSDRNPGYPHEQFELNAEDGNAYGRIQQRKINLNTSLPQKGFFRWRIDPEN